MPFLVRHVCHEEVKKKMKKKKELYLAKEPTTVRSTYALDKLYVAFKIITPLHSQKIGNLGVILKTQYPFCNLKHSDCTDSIHYNWQLISA